MTQTRQDELHELGGGCAARRLPRRRRLVAECLRLARRFAGDRRGGTAVQMMVMLPAILLAFVLSVKLWEAMMIRRSLHTGTYLATRYLSLYPPANPDPYQWADIARRFVWAELKNNPFVDEARLNDVFAPVEVFLIDGSNQCTDKFRVTAEYVYFGPVGQQGELGLPAKAQFRLSEERIGEVACD